MTVPDRSTTAGATAAGATAVAQVPPPPAARSEAEDYLARVRAALADLEDDERDDLLDDLAVHLHEVAAEPGGTLRERLGEPGRYAAELRASAGLPERSDPRGHGRRAGATSRVSARAAVLLRRLDGVPGVARLRAFWPELRPGWWVLRGYLVAWLLCAAAFDDEARGLRPKVEGSAVLGLALVAACVWVSVRVGRREVRWRADRRALSALAGVVLVLAVLGYAANSSTYVYQSTEYAVPTPVVPRAGVYAGGSAVTDVHAYDAEGRPLTGVRLYDQNGRPIVAGGAAPLRVQTDGIAARNVYPRQPTPGPSAVPSTSRAVPPSVPPLVPSAPGAPAASAPTPTTTPESAPTPTPTPPATAPPPSDP